MIKPTCSKLYMIPYIAIHAHVKTTWLSPLVGSPCSRQGGAIYSLKGWTWASAQRVMVPGPGIRVSTDGVPQNGWLTDVFLWV